MRRFLTLSATTLFLTACGGQDEGITQEDLLNDFPNTPAKAAAAVWQMNCEQLETVEFIMEQIDTLGVFARPVIAAAPLDEDDRAAMLELLDADNSERRDAERYVNTVQFVKRCG